jgi:hypothetical protein
MARAVVRSDRFTGRRLTVILVATAIALVTVKGVLSRVPSDRDARALAAQVRRVIDPRDFDRIVFVDMKPFYGLNVYLDRHTTGTTTGAGRADENAAYMSRGALCDELTKGHRDLVAVKHRRANRFVSATQSCGEVPRPIGTVHADGADIDLYRITATNAG